MIDSELLVDDIYTQGFHIIDQFLEQAHYQALTEKIHTIYQTGLMNSAKIGQQQQAHQNEAIRKDDILWIDEESQEPSIKAYLKQTQEIAQILNQSLFLGLIQFETHFAAYQPGTFYKKHIDQFSNTKDRKISCVYYLNPNWQEEYGGELNLYDKENQLMKQVYPQGNRFICFNSELPHEVCITHQPRYSIAGWMKSRNMSLVV